MCELDIEHQVALEIYRFNKKCELIYFSKLLTKFKELVDRKQLGMIIDKLFDLCIIDADWVQEEGEWVRAIRMTSEYIPFFEELDAQVGDNK